MLVGSRNIDCAMVAIAASNLYKHAMYPDAEKCIQDRNAEYMMDIFLKHYNYDDFWKKLDLSTRFDFIKTPIYHIGGWLIFLQKE